MNCLNLNYKSLFGEYIDSFVCLSIYKHVYTSVLKQLLESTRYIRREIGKGYTSYSWLRDPTLNPMRLNIARNYGHRHYYQWTRDNNCDKRQFLWELLRHNTFANLIKDSDYYTEASPYQVKHINLYHKLLNANRPMGDPPIKLLRCDSIRDSKYESVRIGRAFSQLIVIQADYAVLSRKAEGGHVGQQFTYIGYLKSLTEKSHSPNALASSIKCLLLLL